MRVVLADREQEPADLELHVADEEATVGDLLAALEIPDAGGIVIDGRFCHEDLALAEIGIYEGARVCAAAAPPSEDRPASELLELRVVAGLDAGRRLPIGREGVTVGRDPDCELVLRDDGVSRRHLRVAPGASGLRATVADLGSSNGTWVEGLRIEQTELSPGQLFEAGDVALTVAPRGRGMAIDPLRQARRDGTIPFNRPPRARRPDVAAALSAPERAPDPELPSLSIVSAVGPLVLGLVLVIVLHNILFAFFMLLSPVLVVGTWLEGRRKAQRTARGNTREQARELTRFRELVAERHADELTRLRAALPDPAELLRRATDPDPRLWERRPEHDDFLSLMGGLGEVPFRPPLADRHVSPAPQAEEILAAYARLELAPVRVDLDKGGVVGLVGPRDPALAVARSLLCQAAVLHGPADLRIAVLTDGAGRDVWDWAKWLPHVRDASSGGARRLLAADSGAAAALAAELADPDRGDARRALVVLDDPALIEGRGAPGRALLRRAEQISGIVLASSAERLPASCTTVVELSTGGAEAALRRPQAGELIDPLLAAGVSRATARECALALARFEDTDLELSSGALPDRVELLGLLGLRDLDGTALRERWRSSALEPDLRATFALSQDGPFGVDLVIDGPHGLIAGTTGAGKSELLRTLVAALAATHGPDRLNFVLIDYKGGSAFAQCAELPHTVGLVTDLDEQLGERALQSLEAELRHRERVLREHGAGDLIEYGRLIAEGRAQPLPRVVVIIDEFATLAAELPEFVASLVGIAQRGRSLGVHLLLATQRPSGAVNENIRANTNIRICLRVNTPQESSDVIDAPAAAQIGRNQPGRAQIRLGPSELVPIQTALVSASSAAGAGGALELRPFRFPAPAEPSTADGDRAGVQEAARSSDLVRLVEAARDAFAGRDAPRRPWLPPLPPEVPLSSLLQLGAARPLAGERGLVAPLALADDPAAQAQYPVGWNLDAGNLLLFGIGGSGTTTALATLALSLAELADPARVHLYVMDFGAGELAPLEQVPNVGAVLGAADHERHRRLLRRLHDELRARRGLDAGARASLPRIVLLVDGYAGFTSEHSDLAGEAAREQLARVWADGSELGVHVAIAADRLGAVPVALSSLAQQRLAFQLAETADYAQFGISRRAVPRFAPGRAIAGGSAQVLQVAMPGPSLADAVAMPGPSPADAVAPRAGAAASAGRPAAGGPPPVGVLPEVVGVQALVGAGREEREPLFIPIGIGDEMLQPAGFELYEGEHAVIAGPPRTGRTTALLVVAEVASALYPDFELSGIATRRSALRDCVALGRLVTAAGEIAELVAQLRAAKRPQLLLIDDAEVVDDPMRALSELFSAPLATLHVVVAGRIDALRGLGHWSGGARRSRTGLILQPDLTVDGQLLGVTLPRRPAPPARPGCGYRVHPGGFELVQVAVPEIRARQRTSSAGP
jgi:DNA segregation ATPase FtsK/SpoIIIE, S-DNA-T family